MGANESSNYLQQNICISISMGLSKNYLSNVWRCWKWNWKKKNNNICNLNEVYISGVSAWWSMHACDEYFCSKIT